MTPKDLLFRLLAVALSVGLVLLAAELVLRLAAPAAGYVRTGVQSPPRNLPFDQPDFRDLQPPGAKAPGTFRLLVLGDSFVWGAGVYPLDTYPRRLETRLASLDSEVDFEVLSWCHPGWNTQHVWQSVRPALERLDPDLLILSFTLNDAEPSQEAKRKQMTDSLHRQTPQGRLGRALYGGSALYRLGWDRLENRRQRRAFTAYYRNLFTGPHWQHCREAIRELRDAARARGIELVLVVWPVFDSQFDRAYAYRRLHRRLGATARELEIRSLDLLATFRRVDVRRLAVVPFTDPHPNELAHRIAADELTNYLVDEQLVPASFSVDRPRRQAVKRR